RDLTVTGVQTCALPIYLLDNGMTREQYHWFANNQVKARCVMGTDYYITNEHLVTEDGRVEPSGEIFGYYVITHQYYQRYGLPVRSEERRVGKERRSRGV